MAEMEIHGAGCRAVVAFDNEDLELLSQYRWRLLIEKKSGQRYAVSSNKGGVYMHRLIVGAGKGELVDHKNGNGLDNRRENLRICTHSQNHANEKVGSNGKTSKYKGVSLRSYGRWSANIMVRRRQIRLGIYDREESAAHAYDQAAVYYFGEFARTNFPQLKSMS